MVTHANHIVQQFVLQLRSIVLYYVTEMAVNCQVLVYLRMDQQEMTELHAHHYAQLCVLTTNNVVQEELMQTAVNCQMYAYLVMDQ